MLPMNWILDRLPMTNNRLLRSHWAVRKREKTAWGVLLRSQHPPPQQSEGKRRVEITVFRNRLQDKDNSYASVKPLVDALVHQGFLEDDRPALLDLQVRETQVPRKEQRTEVLMLE